MDFSNIPRFNWRPPAGTISRIVKPFLPFWDFLKRLFSNSRARRYKAVIILLTAYVLAGLVTALPIYKFHIDNDLTRVAERIFPYPAAIVDSGFITLHNFHKQVGFVDQFSARTGQQFQGSPTDLVLDQLIEDKLIAKFAAKQGFSVSQKDVDDAYNKVLKDNGGAKEVEKVLNNLYNMSLSDFKGLVRGQVVKDKVRDDLLVRLKASHILVADEKRAQEVLDKVKGGGNWNDLAKQFSEDTNTRDKGGDLGFNGRGVLNKALEDAIFATPVGQIDPSLIKTDFGFHIIRVDERNKGTIDKSYDDLLKDLKSKTRIIKLVK